MLKRRLQALERDLGGEQIHPIRQRLLDDLTRLPTPILRTLLANIRRDGPRVEHYRDAWQAACQAWPALEAAQ